MTARPLEAIEDRSRPRPWWRSWSRSEPVRTVEQAVYGSFPFWDRGYALLGHSPGCRADWLERFRRACQQFGERPRGVVLPAGQRCWFTLRAEASCPWTLVGVSEHGLDDRGRPGALAFHGLFVDDRTAKAIQFSPFALIPALRERFEPHDRDLDTIPVRPTTGPIIGHQTTVTRNPGDRADSSIGSPVEDLDRWAEDLQRGRPRAVASPEPIDHWIGALWPRLTGRTRRRIALATWTFAPTGIHDFDLRASPCHD